MQSINNVLFQLEYRFAKRLPSSTKYHLAFLPEKSIKWFINPKGGPTFLTPEMTKYNSFVLPEQHRVCEWNPERSDWYSFAFVRHPVQRFLRCWQSKIFLSGYFIFNLSSEEAKAMQYLDAFFELTEGKNLLRRDPHFSLKTAKFPPNELSFAGRLKSFSSDLKPLNSRIGLHINASLPAPNKTEKPSIISKQTSRIEDLHATDMITHGY